MWRENVGSERKENFTIFAVVCADAQGAMGQCDVLSTQPKKNAGKMQGKRPKLAKSSYSSSRKRTPHSTQNFYLAHSYF